MVCKKWDKNFIIKKAVISGEVIELFEYENPVKIERENKNGGRNSNGKEKEKK